VHKERGAPVSLFPAGGQSCGGDLCVGCCSHHRRVRQAPFFCTWEKGQCSLEKIPMRLGRITLIVDGPRHAYSAAHLCRAEANARPEDRGALTVRAAGEVLRRIRGDPHHVNFDTDGEFLGMFTNQHGSSALSEHLG